MYRTLTWIRNFFFYQRKSKHLIATLTFDDKFAASMVGPDPVGTMLPSSFLKNSIYIKSNRQQYKRRYLKLKHIL